MQLIIPQWLLAVLVVWFISDRYISNWWTKRCLSGTRDDTNDHMFKAVDAAVKSSRESAQQSATMAGIMSRELKSMGTYALAAKRLLAEKSVQTIYLPKEEPKQDIELGSETGNIPQTIPLPETNGRFKAKSDM